MGRICRARAVRSLGWGNGVDEERGHALVDRISVDGGVSEIYPIWANRPCSRSPLALRIICIPLGYIYTLDM